MFKVATVPDCWSKACDERFAAIEKRPVLKRTGYAYVIDEIEKQAPRAILEFGHGDSPLFDLYGAGCEFWGVDDLAHATDKSAMGQFLNRVTDKYGVKLINGLLGEVEGLPANHFDLVTSVSVIEHIPLKKLDTVLQQVMHCLKPGGYFLSSYDVPLGQWTKPVFNAVRRAGLEWLEPKSHPVFDWRLPDACFEDLRDILKYYLPRELPPAERAHKWPSNFVTVLIGARKPVDERAAGGLSVVESVQSAWWEARWLLSPVGLRRNRTLRVRRLLSSYLGLPPIAR